MKVNRFPIWLPPAKHMSSLAIIYLTHKSVLKHNTPDQFQRPKDVGMLPGDIPIRGGYRILERGVGVLGNCQLLKYGAHATFFSIFIKFGGPPKGVGVLTSKSETPWIRPCLHIERGGPHVAC